jgi:hypothetical protein
MTEIQSDSWSDCDQKAVRKQLDRILKSSSFQQSRRRQQFLEYIVNETLEGCGDRLKDGSQGLCASILNPQRPHARRYEDAIATLEGLQTINTIGIHLYLAASRAALGQKDQARAELTRFFGFDPKDSIRSCEFDILGVYKQAEDREHFRQNLLKAG